MVEWLAGNRIRGTSTERTSTTGIGNAVGGWVELARTTLGSGNANIDVTSIPDKRYYMLLCSTTGSQGDDNIHFRCGNGSFDSATSDYAYRYNTNGGSDSTSASVNHIIGGKTQLPTFTIYYISNLSSKEKLWVGNNVYQNTAGAGTAPNRWEYASKYTNISNVIDQIRATTTVASQFSTGSEVVVLGWDPADTHTTNFWEELASVDTGAGEVLDSGTFASKKYLWFQFDIVVDEYNNTNATIRFNSDQNGNYARRLSQNGMGTDNTATGQTNMTFTYSGGKRVFGNYFVINNSSSEKLAIGHTTAIGTAANSTSEGAGVAPRRVEVVGKWANTSSQITQIEVLDTAQGDLGLTSGTIKVWGSD